MATRPSMEPPKKKQRTTREPEPAILSREMEDLETYVLKGASCNMALECCQTGRGTNMCRQANRSHTSLEVDHMILDYLLHHAITTCLRSREQRMDDEDIERLLLQADEFLALFKRRYGKYNFDPEMRFRQQLLQLVTLFTQRFTRNSTTPSKQSLETLRERNQARARHWIGTALRVPSARLDTTAYHTELPLPVEDLENNRARILATVDIPAEDDLYDDPFYGTRAAVSLLDLLPMFMAVSAQINEICNSQMKKPLMQLAATWMLQACLEQYCVFGTSGTDAIDEAFAWGYKVREPNDQRSLERQRLEDHVATALGGNPRHRASDATVPLAEQHRHSETLYRINSMFEAEDQAVEVDGWEEIRDATLEELLPSDRGHTNDLASHLAHQSEAHSYARAEDAFIGYLKALAQCIPLPLLVQLERGQMEGMTTEETQDFVKGCGVDIMELLA